MVKYPDVSLLIQGPITNKWSDQAGKNLEEYKKLFGEIVVSTWSNCMPMAGLMNLFYDDALTIVHQQYEIDPALDVQYNMGRQALTTLRGLRACTNPYVVKHRTDEYYSNLDVLVDKFYEGNCNKWVCAPVCFLPATQYKFHAADHLYIAPRNRLINTFKETMANLWTGTYEKNRNMEPAAEITFTTNFLGVEGWPCSNQHYTSTMLENFDIVPLESLMPFSISIGTKGHTFTTPEQVYDDMPFLRRATIEDLVKL